MTYKPHINLQVEVSHFENDKLVSQPDKHVVIMSNNATLLHEIIFPPNTTHVQVKTTGTGTLYTQVSWSYHVDKRRSKKDFEIRVIKCQSNLTYGHLCQQNVCLMQEHLAVKRQNELRDRTKEMMTFCSRGKLINRETSGGKENGPQKYRWFRICYPLGLYKDDNQKCVTPAVSQKLFCTFLKVCFIELVQQ
ncbi:unnamed protein product [Allacma fusca]|uniref:Uncharacterized protein n=1 Tax=Allacma fusca TaxID=39272 RepID=A0A8J2IWZ9_9HEXA|nr:unnamed protein product [Allacma fusca]